MVTFEATAAYFHVIFEVEFEVHSEILIEIHLI